MTVQTMENAPVSKWVEIARKRGWLITNKTLLLKAIAYGVPLTKDELEKAKEAFSDGGYHDVARMALENAEEIVID